MKISWGVLLAGISLTAMAAWESVVEAETGRCQGGGSVVVVDELATGGKCVELRCKGRIDEPAGVAPVLDCEFEIPKKGRYNISLKVYADGNSTDSGYAKVDDGAVQKIFLDRHKVWYDYALMPVRLAAGRHVVHFIPRESGMRVDSVRIYQEGYPKDALARFKEPPVWPKKGEHPRLLARAEDVEIIKSRLSHSENAPAWGRIQELNGKPLLMELDPVKDRSERGVWSAARLGQIEARAFTYLLMKDEKLGCEAVEAMAGFLRTVALKDGYQDVTRPMGQTIYVASLVYDWCYGLMTPELRTEFIERCEDICTHMEVGFPPIRQGNVTGHGGEAQIFRDLLSFGIAVFDESPYMYRICAGRFFNEMVEPRNKFYASGRHHQGNAYGAYRYQWEVFGGWVFRRLCGIEPYDSAIKGMHAFWLYGRLPNGAMLEDGDNYQRAGRYATFVEAPFMNYTYTRNSLSKGEFLRQGGARWAVNNPVTFLLFNDPSIPVEEPETLSLTHYFSAPLGSMIARSGWGMGTDADPVVVSFKGAGTQYNNHHHADAGSFQIYHRGLLAADLGQYGRYGTPYDWGFNKQSISHNTLLVYDPQEVRKPEVYFNDGGQLLPNGGGEPISQKALDEKGYHVGETTAHAFGPDAKLPLYSHMKCDLSKMYGTRVADFTRSFVYFNTNNPAMPACVVVYDHVTATNPVFRKSWVINSYLPPVMTKDGFRIVWDQQDCCGQLDVVSLLPTARRIVSGDAMLVHGRRFEPPFADYPSANGQRTEVMPAEDSATDTFLHVMAVGAAGEMKPFTAKLVRGEALVAAEFAGHVTAFAQDGKLLAKADKLEISEMGAKVLLTDLAAGIWTVKRGGKVVASRDVPQEDHTLFFVAEQAGVYEIARDDTLRSAGASADMASLRAVPAHGYHGVMIGRKVVSDLKTFVKKQLLYAPVAPVAGASYQALGGGFALTTRGGVCKFTAGAEIFKLDDLEIPLHGGLEARDGEWYLPAYLLGQLLGYNVKTTEVADSVRFMPRTMQNGSLLPLASYSPADADPLPNLFDGNPETYWAGGEKDGSAVVVLAKAQPVAGVEISWHLGERRNYVFEIHTSMDGRTFELAYSGTSDMNARPQRFTFDSRTARFVKYVGHGNNQNKWNSVSEMKVLGK